MCRVSFLRQQGWPQTHYTAEAGLELLILPFLPEIILMNPYLQEGSAFKETMGPDLMVYAFYCHHLGGRGGGGESLQL